MKYISQILSVILLLGCSQERTDTKSDITTNNIDLEDFQNNEEVNEINNERLNEIDEKKVNIVESVDKIKKFYNKEGNGKTLEEDDYALETQSTLTPGETQLERDQRNFRREIENRKLTENIIILEKRRLQELEDTKLTEVETINFLRTFLEEVQIIEKQLADEIILGKAADLTALALERSILGKARLIIKEEDKLIKESIKYAQQLGEDFDKFDSLKKEGSFNYSYNKYKNVVTLYEKICRGWSEYNDNLMALNLWIDKNWGSFEEDFGEKVINDKNIANDYTEKTRELVKMRKNVQKNRLLFKKRCVSLIEELFEQT